MKYSFVLNTHIPQCDRDWAYEALFHCYLPLFEYGKDYKLTVGLSPQLIYEFTDKKFPQKAEDFFNRCIKQINNSPVEHLKKYYIDYYEKQFEQLKKCNFNLADLWKDNQWEILAYPSTHCVMPLLTEKLIEHFLDEGEKVIKDFFGVTSFNGVWMPELAFEDGINNQRKIITDRYKYTFGTWKTTKGYGGVNHLYEDIDGLNLIIRNGTSQQAFWGEKSLISGHPDFRETHRKDAFGNKIFRIGGGVYYPQDVDPYINRSIETMKKTMTDETGEYCAIMFDTEYLGHHFWEGNQIFHGILKHFKNDISTCNEIVTDKAIQPRDIDMSAMSYTWGTMGDFRSNGTIESWVNGKNHRFIQIYREAMIYLEKNYSKDLFQKKAQALRGLFSSDWLFMQTFQHNDIHDSGFKPLVYSEKQIMDNYNYITKQIAQIKKH